MNNIQIGIDDTDNIVFFCPKCGNVMDIENVITSKLKVDITTKKVDNCTWIYLHCSQCNTKDQRKMYWTESLDMARRTCNFPVRTKLHDFQLAKKIRENNILYTRE